MVGGGGVHLNITCGEEDYRVAFEMFFFKDELGTDWKNSVSSRYLGVRTFEHFMQLILPQVLFVSKPIH